MKIDIAGNIVDLGIEDDEVITDVVLIAAVERLGTGEKKMYIRRGSGTSTYTALGMVISTGDCMRGIDGNR